MLRYFVYLCIWWVYLDNGEFCDNVFVGVALLGFKLSEKSKNGV